MLQFPVRRTGLALAALALLGSVTLAVAGPASADVPEGWSPNPEPVNLLHAVLLLGGVPLLLFVVIVVATYLPSLVRGERIAPGAPTVENQWLGGPRRGTAELAGPDSDTSEAGGASARW